MWIGCGVVVLGCVCAVAPDGEQCLSNYGYVGGDQYQHAVSLGVFSSEARSQRRWAKLEALG